MSNNNYGNYNTSWFINDFKNFQLDVVGFLAILGEGSVLSSAQMLGASRISYLPRLIPAPQALFRAQRPSRLPSHLAQVSAIYSGNARAYVNYIAHLLLDRSLPPHTVRCVKVTRNATNGNGVRVRRSGSILWVSLLGCGISIALLATSAALHDGMSIIATVVLSSLSTLAGAANKWKMKLAGRGSNNPEIPNGDVVIRYPNGSFLVVNCDEKIARELFFAPEEITYWQSERSYQLMSLLGTSMLMVGVICLANAHEILQVMWAACFIILNAAYWIVAALPHKDHWDLSSYKVVEDAITGGQASKSYAEALWKSIAITRSSEWVEMCAPARPTTRVWRIWTEVAVEKAREVGPKDEQALPPAQNLIWPFSGTVFDIPDWNVHEALRYLSISDNTPRPRSQPSLQQVEPQAPEPKSRSPDVAAGAQAADVRGEQVSDDEEQSMPRALLASAKTTSLDQNTEIPLRSLQPYAPSILAH